MKQALMIWGLLLFCFPLKNKNDCKITENRRAISMKKYLVDRMYKASSGIANAIFVTIGIG